MYDIIADACIRTTTPPGLGAGTGASIMLKVPPNRSSCHAFIGSLLVSTRATRRNPTIIARE
ncbi:hypothetical protein PTKU46_75910 [Paraburkholderia terrae]